MSLFHTKLKVEILYRQYIMAENYQNIKRGGNILYDSLDEYDQICARFKDDLPELISQYELDDWTYNWNEKGNGMNNALNLENILECILLDLTKHQNHQWATKTSELIGLAIRGINQAVGCLKYSRDIINCAMCDSNNSFCVQSIFSSREICRIFITNTINNIIFNDSGDSSLGELEKIRVFKCSICNNYVRFLMKSANDDLCISCYTEDQTSSSSDE